MYINLTCKNTVHSGRAAVWTHEVIHLITSSLLLSGWPRRWVPAWKNLSCNFSESVLCVHCKNNSHSWNPYHTFNRCVYCTNYCTLKYVNVYISLLLMLLSILLSVLLTILLLGIIPVLLFGLICVPRSLFQTHFFDCKPQLHDSLH